MNQQYLPSHPEVPLSARLQAAEVDLHYTKEKALANQKRTQEVRKIIQNVQEQLREVIGADHYDKFRHFLWSDRIKTRSLLQPPEGLMLDPKILSHARKERGNVYLQKLGIEPKQITELVKESRIKLEELLNYHSHYGQFAKVYPSVKYFELFGNFLHDEARPVTVFQPPYGGWQAGWFFDNFGDNSFRAGHTNFIDPVAGLAGHELSLDNDDAGGFDFAETIADTQIAFWYQPPATGIVEVELEVQSLQAAHHLCTDDEFGWSESTTRQNNILMMHVLHPFVAGPSFADASFFEWKTDESECVDRQFIPSGARFSTRLISSGAIPAGQWVVIRAGTRTVSRSFTDDVEIHSSSRFQYLINSVAVRIIP